MNSQKILISGARGFIGKALGQSLVTRNAHVTGIGHGTITATRLLDFGLQDWVNGEIDHANLQHLANSHGPFDCIFHLAGGSHVGRSFQHPAEDFSRTVISASRLLEWVRLFSPQTPIVIVSSAAVYGAGHEGPIAEDATLRPFSPYGAHKAMLEALAKSYCENFGLQIAICRLFSVYGEGLQKQLLFDLCVKCEKAIETGQSFVELGGSGNELRDWLHVSDVCELLWAAKEYCSKDCPVVNGGSGQPITVKSIAEMLLENWNRSLLPNFDQQSRRGDPKSLVADVTIANSWGFQPQVDLTAGIKRVVDYYRSGEQPRD